MRTPNPFWLVWFLLLGFIGADMDKQYYDYLHDIDGYGLLSLTIDDFTVQLAIDLLSQGVIKVPNSEKLLEIDDCDKCSCKPLVDALQPQIKKIEKKIKNAIERGEINAAYTSRHFDTEAIDTSNTLVKYDDIYKFLDTYGLAKYISWDEDETELGARYKKEIDIADKVFELIKDGKRFINIDIQAEEIDAVEKQIDGNHDILRKIIKENLYLNAQKKSDEQKHSELLKPIATLRERETLLIIIAALAKEARVDITKTSKSASIIESLTQQLGSPVGSTTIERHLKSIFIALESRAQ
jgi:hypothetical protein